MKSKLFDMVLHESKYDGMELITSEKELKTLLDMGCTVYARNTGPFGEDENAKVVCIGKVKDIHHRLNGLDFIIEQEGFDEEEDDEDEWIERWIEKNGEATAIVIDKSIGQEPCNFYTLDAWDIRDCDLWVSTSDVEKYFKSTRESCPNCGGEEFYYVKLDKLVMGREKFEACTKCGAMYPILSYERRNNKE